MHTPHALFTCRELHRQELLAYAEEQRLVKLTRTGTPCIKPHEAMVMAILTLVHRLTAFMSPALRERPSAGPASTATDPPRPFVAPKS
jgi:hypothetical protein